MGNCAGGTDSKQASKYFYSDQQTENGSEIYHPRASSLFNTLRKTAELAVIYPDSHGKQPLFANTLSLDIDNVKDSDLKPLINNRRVLVIGTYQAYQSTVLRKIKSLTAAIRIYVLSEQQCQGFLETFPVFHAKNWENGRTMTNQLPIMVFDSEDIIEKYARLRVYVHTTNKMDQKIYKQIGIREEELILEPKGLESEKAVKEYYLKQLIKAERQNVVLLHSPKLPGEALSEVFCAFLNQKYGISAAVSKIYLSQNLPKSVIKIDEEQESKKIEDVSNKKSAVQTYCELFTKLENQIGKQKTDRAYQLLNTLTTNIYSNPDNQEKRKVRRTIKQMRELLDPFKPGRQLLQELGWREENDSWVNRVESKYLKIFKTDFDLGHKMYKAQ